MIPIQAGVQPSSATPREFRLEARELPRVDEISWYENSGKGWNKNNKYSNALEWQDHYIFINPCNHNEQSKLCNRKTASEMVSFNIHASLNLKSWIWSTTNISKNVWRLVLTRNPVYFITWLDSIKKNSTIWISLI